MIEKILSHVATELAKAVTAVSACANAVVCYFAKAALDTNTRYYFMTISVALILVMLASFAVVGKNFFAAMKNEEQNGVHIAA